MKQRNGTILVTEPLLIVQATVAGNQTLPSIPTGDAGDQILQVTLRSVDNAWEFRFGNSGDYFWMAGGDILVLPIFNRPKLAQIEIRAVTAAADMRIIYEA